MKQIFYLLLLMFSTSCIQILREVPKDKDKAACYDYRLFQETPAWNLAKAVWDQDTGKIGRIVRQDSSLVNYREDKYGQTLIFIAIQWDHFKSVKALVDNGADINIRDSFNGRTPLIEAGRLNPNLECVRLLIEHGADVNARETEKGMWTYKAYNTPLSVVARYGGDPEVRLDIVKLLVSHGADINYMLGDSLSILDHALISDHYDIVLYLLKAGAEYRYSETFNYANDNKYTVLRILDYLRMSLFELDSKEYKEKMEVVAYLKERGLDYFSTPIPDSVLKRIKIRYPDQIEEYLRRY
ncbi:MAG: ankyrin repeat domain-containing protein [Bacteroidales bacterium]